MDTDFDNEAFIYYSGTREFVERRLFTFDGLLSSFHYNAFAALGFWVWWNIGRFGGSTCGGGSNLAVDDETASDFFGDIDGEYRIDEYQE